MTRGFTTFVEHAPGRRCENEDLPVFFSSAKERTHIVSRNIASDSDTVVSMAISATEKLFEELNIDAGDCDGLILASCTNPGSLSQASNDVASHFGIPASDSCDYACSGFPRATQIALEKFDGCDKHIVIVTSEILSRLIDWSREDTAILFGDRSAATTVHPDGQHKILLTEANVTPDPEGLLSLKHRQDAMHFDGRLDDRKVICMQGRPLYRRAPAEMMELTREAIDRLGLTMADLTHILPHQANGKFAVKLSKMLEDMGLSEVETVDEISGAANTAASSIPCAMTHLQKRLYDGALVSCPAVGAGPEFEEGSLTNGIVVFRTEAQ